MIKLSIIVPVYNVEQYLRKCVDSLLAQDISDYEIILVDDGSTDFCPSICDEYARMNELENERVRELEKTNIKVIHRENGGLSAARNSGIEVARGKYVMFVDSDDYIEPNVLGGLMEKVEREQLDVLRYDYRNVRIVDSRKSIDDREYEVFEPNKTPHKVDRRTDVVDGVTYLNERMGYGCYAWQFILRCDIIYPSTLNNQHSTLFTEGIHFEDVDWLPRMILKAKKVGSTQMVVYNYFWREGSITLTQGNKDKIKKNLNDRMYIIAKYSELRKQHSECTWLKNMQSSMAAGVMTTIAREFYRERINYIKMLCELKVFPLAIADQGMTYAKRARMINILGAKAYCMIMHIRK